MSKLSLFISAHKKKKKETKIFGYKQATYNMNLLQFAISHGGKVLVKHKQEISWSIDKNAINK